MENKPKARTILILLIMRILTWIVFIGACIKTGAILYSFFVSLFINPEGAKNLYLGLNLSEILSFSIWHYITMVLFVIFLSGLKAYIAYLVTNIFLKINLADPFSITVALLISKISQVAFGIGILDLIASGYSEWLMNRGVALHTLPEYLGVSSEYLFFAGIIFIIAQVFKRGIEIQIENELTV